MDQFWCSESGSSSASPPTVCAEIGNTADELAYHCLVEGIEFYPLLVREAGIVAQFCRILPAVELAVGEQVYRTRSQSNRWREDAIWENERFVFEVSKRSVDLSVSCINISGEGLKGIGAANITLAPNESGTSVQQISLLRRSRTGNLILAGILHLQLTFYGTGGRSKPGPLRLPENKYIATEALFKHPKRDMKILKLPSPGIRDVNRRASFPASIAEHASLHVQHMSTGSPEKIFRGSWSYGKARDGITRVVWAKGGLAVMTRLVVMIAIVIFWWSTSSVPVEVEPIDVSLGINGKFHQPRQVSRFSSRNDGTDAYHAATYKYVIDVLAFGS